MTLSGQIHDPHWDVNVETLNEEAGVFRCRIWVNHTQQEGDFEHGFELERTYRTERDAVLAGLREGMIWIEQKMAGTLRVE